MRRMYSQKELEEVIKKYLESGHEITSKGITNTGSFTNNGSANISGNLRILSNLIVEKALSAKTITQSHANWESPITINGHTGGADYEVTLTYGKCVLIANILHIVVIVKATNNGSSSITHPHIIFNNIELSSSLKAKIYDMDGKSLEETPLTPSCPISSSSRGASGSLNAWTSRYAELRGIQAKLFRASNGSDVQIEVREGLPTLNAGETGYAIFGFDLVII